MEAVQEFKFFRRAAFSRPDCSGRPFTGLIVSKELKHHQHDTWKHLRCRSDRKIQEFVEEGLEDPNASIAASFS